MNSLAKALTSGLTVQRPCRVLRVDPVAAGWQLHIEPGPEHPSVVTASSVILAMPAPQISPLFATVAQADAGISTWLDPISQVLFDPVITVMAAIAQKQYRPW
ncbi:MAG: hypothetical protein HC929_21845 [Leptolyngbyaceae cyanobacterium SM2_5_2]|nr:hypothetical protein [Leptolyngbyaceae cyanobacterium SM2_5_2]